MNAAGWPGRQNGICRLVRNGGEERPCKSEWVSIFYGSPVAYHVLKRFRWTGGPPGPLDKRALSACSRV